MANIKSYFNDDDIILTNVGGKKSTYLPQITANNATIIYGTISGSTVQEKLEYLYKTYGYKTGLFTLYESDLPFTDGQTISSLPLNFTVKSWVIAETGYKISFDVYAASGYGFEIRVVIRDPNNNIVQYNGNDYFNSCYTSRYDKYRTMDLYTFTFAYYNNSIIPFSCQIGRVYFNDDIFGNTSGVPSAISSSLITNIFNNSVVDSYDPYTRLNDENDVGGYAPFDYSGDTIDFPTIPTLTASNSGFVTLFSPSIVEMRDLSAYMWTGLFDIATYKKIFADPMDCILGVGIVPVIPQVSPTSQTITVGNISTGVTASRVTSQFFVKDCGTLTVNGASKSNMDFSPYTKAEIYLPYCGTHSISVDDIMNATLSLKYYIDLLTGACTACIKVNKTNSDGSTLNSVLYQFSGNCMNVIPFTSQNLTTTIQAIVGAVATIGATVATGGAGAVGAGAGAKSALAGSMIASEVNNVMNMKPTIMKSGNLTANCGFLATQTPMLILTMPNLCRPSTENEHFGTPYYKSGTLSDFSGFTVIDSVHLENLYCTESERAEIEELLKMGVIV